jgi:hypothetical protein
MPLHIDAVEPPHSLMTGTRTGTWIIQVQATAAQATAVWPPVHSQVLFKRFGTTSGPTLSTFCFLLLGIPLNNHSRRPAGLSTWLAKPWTCRGPEAARGPALSDATCSLVLRLASLPWARLGDATESPRDFRGVAVSRPLPMPVTGRLCGQPDRHLGPEVQFR